VLDNMESITGSALAIKNTLKPEEQQELRTFLAELLGGETMVLMGSRGPEEWLAEGEDAPLRPNDVYLLPGLDGRLRPPWQRGFWRGMSQMPKNETLTARSEEFRSS